MSLCVPSSTNFCKSFRRISINSSLNVWNHSHLVLNFCLLKDFTLEFQLHGLWLVCWYLLFLAGSVLEGGTFLRLCAFGPVVRFIILELLVIMYYEPLCFYSVSCHFSFFMSNFIDLSPLPFFFLMSLCESLPISIIFSKNQLLVSLVIFLLLLSSFPFHLFLLQFFWFLSFY